MHMWNNIITDSILEVLDGINTPSEIPKAYCILGCTLEGVQPKKYHQLTNGVKIPFFAYPLGKSLNGPQFLFMPFRQIPLW